HAERDPPPAQRDPWSGAPIKPDKNRWTPSPITDRFAVRGTFFNPAVRTPQGRIEIMFRLRERNRLRVDYFETNRRGDQAIARQILFGNEIFAVNDRVTSSVQWRQFGLTYTFSVLRTDRFELGLGLSVHFVEAEAR